MEYRYRNKIPEPLWRVKNLGRSLEIALMSYKCAYSRLTGCSAGDITVERVVSGVYNRQEAAYVALSMKGDRIRTLKKRYDSAEQIMESVFLKMTDERYVKILTCRYSIGMDASDSAKANHYSKSWERELHGKALEEFRRIWRREP